MLIFYESVDYKKNYLRNIICYEFINILKEIFVDFDCMMMGCFYDRNIENILKVLFLM